MENLINEMPSVDIYKKLKNDYYFMPFMKNLGFTENDIKAFEKKYYPELFEEKKKENVVKKPLITRAWLKDFIDIYKRYSEKVNKYFDLGIDVYLSNLPIDDCETMLLKTLKLLLNAKEFDILYVFCGKIDNGENPSFDELCKNLKIE